ncbi:MAG TPA: hypothetical protein VN704_11215 [Verrucomicrobiae bacterium]|nr:hypothetical protein [Verrucomicrobiae bacterium]
MNIVNVEPPFIIEAKTCGCKNKKNISYSLIESSHNLCVDRKEIILAQIQACEKLLNFVKDEIELVKVIKKEIEELKLALDLIHY